MHQRILTVESRPTEEHRYLPFEKPGFSTARKSCHTPVNVAVRQLHRAIVGLGFDRQSSVVPNSDKLIVASQVLYSEGVKHCDAVMILPQLGTT